MLLQHQDSSTPRFGTYSKAYPALQRSSKPHRSWWLLLLATAALLVAAAGGRLLLARHRHQAVLYAVVIDSGSSGTRIYAYNWTQQPAKSGSAGSGGLPRVQPIPPSAAAQLVPRHASKGMYNRVETRPGLDALAANLTALPAALGPLLAWARAVVPARQHASTPLFMMGTGGIRRLPDQQQTKLLAAVRQQLAQSGFRFEASWARVISGDDEGAYGWLALNYQQGRLRLHHQAASAAATAAGSAGMATSITSLGALDLGGSSLQITFEVLPTTTTTSSSSSSKQAPTAAAQPQYNISLAGHTFQLHLHSFRQYGLNEAYDRSITLLLKQQQQQRPQPQVEQMLGGGTSSNSGAAGSSLLPSTNAGLFLNASTDGSKGQQPVPPAAALGAAIQHDLAVARAAGVDADGPAAERAASAAGDPQHQAHLEQQKQADLAVAAAAGYHSHQVPGPDDVAGSADKAGGRSSSSSSRAAVAASSALQGSSSHMGLQPAAGDAAGPLQATLRPSAVQADSSGGLGRVGVRLQGRAQLSAPAAVRRRSSGQLRRRLMQQQLSWLEQLLSTGSAEGSSAAAAGADTVTAVHQQRAQDAQRRHDVKLRQLLREYLLREDPAPVQSSAPANASSAAGPSNGGTPAAPHPVVPADGDGSGGSGSAALGAESAQARLAAVSGHNSSQLPDVRHPCLHEGYKAVYTRVAYEGITPEPPQVLLRGQPDWDSCQAVVSSIVNASAPCAIQEHLPSCVLGTPQPELQGSFMALTGFYVVSRFLGVQDSRGLDPLLDAARTLCGRPWPWVQQHLGSHVNVERYCTWGPYMVKLLLHGLGLEERQVFIAQDGDLGWPLGAVLVEASKLPGFSAPAPSKQQQKQRRWWQRHRKRGRDSGAHGSSLRGSAAVNFHVAQGAAAGAAVQAAGAHSAAVAAHAKQAAHHVVARGPAWSWGLLHHNQASTGLHLSGRGWVVVLGVAWLVIVGWCRGVCRPKAAGPVSLLPLAGLLSSTAGPGRAHISGYPVRGKLSPNRASFKWSSK